MNDTCKHCGQKINFIRMRDGYGWCHSLGSRRCNQLDMTIAEPSAEEAVE